MPPQFLNPVNNGNLSFGLSTRPIQMTEILLFLNSMKGLSPRVQALQRSNNLEVNSLTRHFITFFSACLLYLYQVCDN